MIDNNLTNLAREVFDRPRLQVYSDTLGDFKSLLALLCNESLFLDSELVILRHLYGIDPATWEPQEILAQEEIRLRTNLSAYRVSKLRKGLIRKIAFYTGKNPDVILRFTSTTPTQADTPLSDMGLSVRINTALQILGLNTLGELVSKTEYELFEMGLDTYEIGTLKDHLFIYSVCLGMGRGAADTKPTPLHKSPIEWLARMVFREYSGDFDQNFFERFEALMADIDWTERYRQFITIRSASFAQHRKKKESMSNHLRPMVKIRDTSLKRCGFTPEKTRLGFVSIKT